MKFFILERGFSGVNEGIGNGPRNFQLCRDGKAWYFYYWHENNVISLTYIDGDGLISPQEPINWVKGIMLVSRSRQSSPRPISFLHLQAGAQRRHIIKDRQHISTLSVPPLEPYKAAGYDYVGTMSSRRVGDGPRSRCDRPGHPGLRVGRHLHHSHLRRQHGHELDPRAQKYQPANPTVIVDGPLGAGLFATAIRRKTRESYLDGEYDMKNFQSPKHPCLLDSGC